MLQMLIAGAAVLMVAALQTPAQQKTGAGTDPQPSAPVVLTGCLLVSAEPEPGAEHKEAQFVLINASPAPAPAGEARAPETGTTGVGTTGTGTSGSGASASPTSAQDAAQLVLLTGDPDVPLRRHVNRRVEVHGTMDRRSQPAGSVDAEAAKKDQPRQVRVTKVRRLSGACSGQK